MTSLRDVGETISNTVLENVGRALSRAQERSPLAVDLLESDEAFLAVFDTPGATSSDVQVRFEDNRVEVRIDRFREFYDGFEMVVPGRGLSLDGSVILPPEAAVDPDGATATLKDNGTLHVRVPKVEDEEIDAAEADADETADTSETDASDDADETDAEE